MVGDIIKLITLGLVVGGVRSACQCPDGWTIFQGSCYLSHHTLLNFHDAEDKCEEFGAQLVHVETAIEDTFIKSFVSDLKADRHWLGLQDGVIDGIWKWHGTNNIATFTDWYPGEPSAGTAANCVAISGGHKYQWIDEPCTHRDYRPLCELKTESEAIVG